MSRKHCHRRTVVPLPPRGLRPRLANDQRQDLELVHLLTLDTIARGGATEQALWDLMGAALTWLHTAQALGAGVEEMRQQMVLANRVLDRYVSTGKVGFTGPEYQLAKSGINQMQQLADQVDRATAVAAAQWSEAQLIQLAWRLGRKAA